MKLNDKPLFIVFEGLDGSGKGTQIRMLQERMQSDKMCVMTTAEPTDSVTGGLIRDALSASFKRTPSELAGLFLADRITHNQNPVWGIKKLLSDGKYVICDRYYYSSFAYQGIGTDLDWVMNMNLNCPDILKPDICIFLDVPPDDCQNRIEKVRTHLEIFENKKTQMQIRDKFFYVFDKLGKTENIKIINAVGDKQRISDEIYAAIFGL